jgi:hypothetical protein
MTDWDMMRLLIVGCVLASLGTARASLPDVHVTMAVGPATARKAEVAAIRRILLDAFRSNDAQPASYDLLVSVVELSVETVHGESVITADLHVVISDRAGHILSHVSGCAKVGKRGLQPSELEKLEQQAIEEATVGLIHPLRVQLLRTAPRRVDV